MWNVSPSGMPEMSAKSNSPVTVLPVMMLNVLPSTGTNGTPGETSSMSMLR